MICSRWEGLATDPSKQRRGQQVRDQNHQAPPPLLSCLLRECGPPPIPGGGGGSLVRQHQVIPQTPNAAPWPRNDLMTKGEPVRFFPQKSGVGTSDMGTNSKVIGSRRGVGTVANQSHGGTEMLPISPGHWSAGRSRRTLGGVDGRDRRRGAGTHGHIVAKPADSVPAWTLPGAHVYSGMRIQNARDVRI